MGKMKKITSNSWNFVRAIVFISFVFLLINGCPTEPKVVSDLILGIYSETPSDRLRPDVDSFIGTFKGAGAIFNANDFIDDNTEVQEGGISKKSTMSVDGSKGQYAGWFVQWGNRESPDSETRDMSTFEGGNLSFWVKSSINLEVGIRSGNVQPPGTETSKVILSRNSYPPFEPDNEWHKISIPLSDFTGEAPKADLSQIKIFFVVSSNTPSGGTGGVPKTFWIDDVRWEKLGKKQ